MSKIFIKTNEEGVVTLRHNFPFHKHYGLNKTEEQLLKEGFFVESVPEPNETTDKIAMLHYIDGEFSYTYEDVIIPKTEMEVLQEKNKELESSIADLWEFTLFGGME